MVVELIRNLDGQFAVWCKADMFSDVLIYGKVKKFCIVMFIALNWPKNRENMSKADNSQESLGPFTSTCNETTLDDFVY